MYEELRQVMDPEMPVNIVDLGMVREAKWDGAGVVEVVLRPSFLGCPARRSIENEVRRVLLDKFKFSSIQIVWDFNDPWNLLHISADGLRALLEHGIAVPERLNGKWVVHCPYCHSSNTLLDTDFGPSLCKSIYYCKKCKNPFESIKRFPDNMSERIGCSTCAPHGR